MNINTFLKDDAFGVRYFAVVVSTGSECFGYKGKKKNYDYENEIFCWREKQNVKI